MWCLLILEIQYIVNQKIMYHNSNSMGGGKSNKVTGERALSHAPGSGGDSSQGIKQKKILKPQANSGGRAASIDNHNSSGTKGGGSAGVFYRMASKASRKS